MQEFRLLYMYCSWAKTSRIIGIPRNETISVKSCIHNLLQLQAYDLALAYPHGTAYCLAKLQPAAADALLGIKIIWCH